MQVIIFINDELGNYVVRSKGDIPAALEALKDRPLYAEKWAYFKMVRILFLLTILNFVLM